MVFQKKVQPSAFVDLTEHIIADVRCIKCGTNLRGQSINQRCPQCGHSASDSVFGDYLIYCERAEIARLDEATRVVIYSAMSLALLFAAAAVLMVAGARSVVDAIQRAYDMLFAGVLVFPVVAATGIVLLTRRHAVAYYEAKYLNRRFVIPAALALVVALALLGLVAHYHPYIVQTCLLIAWGILPPVAFLRGLASLMRRMPNLKLARLAAAIAVGVCLLGGLTLLFMLARPTGMTHPDWEGPLIALQLLTTLGWIGLGIGGLRLLTLIRRSFHGVLGG